MFWLIIEQLLSLSFCCRSLAYSTHLHLMLRQCKIRNIRTHSAEPVQLWLRIAQFTQTQLFCLSTNLSRDKGKHLSNHGKLNISMTLSRTVDRDSHAMFSFKGKLVSINGPLDHAYTFFVVVVTKYCLSKCTYSVFFSGKKINWTTEYFLMYATVACPRHQNTIYLTIFVTV